MIVVAEIANGHDGSLGTAYAYVNAVAFAGADAVKFQCHDGNPCRSFRPGTFFPQDHTRLGYYHRTSFRRDQWKLLADRAHELGLKFVLSLWSVDTIERLGGFVDVWKLGASELDNLPLVEAVARTGKPIVLSTGMSSWDEIESAVRCAWKAGTRDLTLLQCTTAYPCPPERIGINVLRDLRDRFGPGMGFGWGRKFGLSDHSGTIWPGIIAAYAGADMLELHVCFSRHCFGPDVSASVTVEELRELVAGVRFVERLDAVDKDAMARELSPMRELFRGERSA